MRVGSWLFWVCLDTWWNGKQGEKIGKFLNGKELVFFGVEKFWVKNRAENAKKREKSLEISRNWQKWSCF